MSFFEYLDSIYLKCTIEIQKEFSLFKQAESHATQSIIGMLRKFFTVIAFFKHLILFPLVKLHILKAPPSREEQMNALEEKAKADKAAKEAQAQKLDSPTATTQAQSVSSPQDSETLPPSAS